MRAINFGTFEIQALYTRDSSIRGEIEISVKEKSQLVNVDKLKKVYYSIDSEQANFERNESITFSPKKVKLKKGKELFLYQKIIHYIKNC